MTRAVRSHGLVACLLALLLLATPQRAQAAGWKSLAYGIVVGLPALFLGLTDVGLLIYDVTKAGQGERPNRDVAIAELVLGSVQLGFGGLLVIGQGADSELLPFVVPDMVLSTGMLIHGSWAVATEPDSGAAMMPSGLTVFPGPSRTMTRSSYLLTPQALPGGGGLLLRGSF